MLYVIINADDLGKNSVVNSSIMEGMSAGAITSSTIMANSISWDEVHKIVDANPQASFGVHLNLTEGSALTKSEILLNNNIVDSQGFFTNKVRKVTDWSDELLEAIFNEWDAQINKIRNIEGIKISHLDGHHHIHTDTPFAFILKKLCEKYEITCVRNRHEFPQSSVKQGIKRIGELLYDFRILGNNKLSRIIEAYQQTLDWRKNVSPILMTNYFCSYEYACGNADYLREGNQDIIIELMCHPGHINYQEEFKEVCARVFQKKKNCKLINYKDFATVKSKC